MTPKTPQKNIMEYSTIGIQMAVGMGVFSYLGFLIDKKRGGGSAFTLVGIFLGLIYIGYEVWKMIKKMSEE